MTKHSFFNPLANQGAGLGDGVRFAEDALSVLLPILIVMVMDHGDSPTALLTLEDVLKWVRERDEARDEQSRLVASIAALEDKLRFAAMLMTPEKAEQIIGPLGSSSLQGERQYRRAQPIQIKPKRRSMIDAIMDVIHGEKGGRSPSWIREKVGEDPDFGRKATAHAISNSLSRMFERGTVVRLNGLYYTPELASAIESGEVIEEHASNSTPTITSLLASVAEKMDGWFKPGDLRGAALNEPLLVETIKANPNAINSWIGRCFKRGELIREGGRYRLLSNENEAPNGYAVGALEAGEGATSPSSSGGDFNYLLT